MRKSRPLLGRKKKEKKTNLAPIHTERCCAVSLSLSLICGPQQDSPAVAACYRFAKNGHAVECDAVSRQNHNLSLFGNFEQSRLPPQNLPQEQFHRAEATNPRTMTTLGTSLTRNPGAYVAQRHSCHTHVEIQAHTIDTSPPSHAHSRTGADPLADILAIQP